MSNNTIKDNRKLDATAITIYCSIIILALALTSFNFFVSDFKVSIGVIFLSVFLFIIPEFPLLRVTVVCAIGIVVVRSAAAADPVSYVANSLSRYLPETAFYLVYGILLYVAYKFFQDKMQKPAFLIITLTIIDYLANTVELLIRIQGETFTDEYQLGLIAVAVCRAIAAWFIIFLFSKYRDTILTYERKLIQSELTEIKSNLESESDKLLKVQQDLQDLQEKIQSETDPAEIEANTATLTESIKSINTSNQNIQGEIQEMLEKEGDS